LTLLNQAIWGIAWTPAGREIVFSSGSQLAETRLWRISTTAEGSSPTPEPLGEDSFSLAVSAGSRRLVYARQSSDADIWRINLRGPGEAAGPPVKLISSTRLDINGEYSPDGRKIAFNSYRSGSEEIWIANADGSHPVQLTSAGGPMVANPLWSPDGQNLVFHSMLGGAPVGVYLISAGGGMPKRVIQGHGSLPNWSRDGKWIYFGSTRSGRAEVWKIPSSGGEPVQITSKGGNGNAFESMDGKFLYYFKSTQIWRIPLGGGEEARIIEGPVSYHMNWFVVEEGIYFISGTPSTVGSPATLYFYSFATAALRAVTKIEAWCWGLTVSPDRRSILFSVWENPSGDLMLVENFR
jgi:Tol biopolymer transport system component